MSKGTKAEQVPVTMTQVKKIMGNTSISNGILGTVHQNVTPAIRRAQAPRSRNGIKTLGMSCHGVPCPLFATVRGHDGALFVGGVASARPLRCTRGASALN